MKKLLLTSLIAVFATAGANAATDYFVGGSVTIATDSEHATVFNVAPEFGWNYDENWDFGLGVKFASDNKYLESEYGLEGDAYAYGANVFARYKVVEFGGAKLLLKGSVGMDFQTMVLDDENIDSETLKRLTVAVAPMVTYDVSESFTLYANLNFLGVSAGYVFENETLGVADAWAFGAMADSSNVINTSDFQIGFLYNF